MSRLTRRHLLRLAGVQAALALAPTACQSTGPLAESGFVPIGGIEQWLEIRGVASGLTGSQFHRFHR